ncbi:MAG: methyltetrahydrofolate cobalamin methyltransferase [Ruminococcaceae bacterium]|nr:methyltetrahydrofolate cobalamin methyltransferase [Oscillospiraceae bacterium]
MIIIGEKLNSSIKSVRAAVESRDAAFVQDLARRQTEAGAAWLDINAATLPDEVDSLVWMGETCRAVCDTPLCIDSPDPAAVGAALERLGGGCMINSITLEENRYNAMIALAKQYDCPLVALCMDDNGMPETPEDRIRIAKALSDRLIADGIDPQKVFIDPMLSPVGVVETAGQDALAVIRCLSDELPTHITCGLSNISYGLPARPNINRAFAVAAMTCGLDSAIVNPLDTQLMRLVYAADAVLGNDEYCENYIDAYRDGFFDD